MGNVRILTGQIFASLAGLGLGGGVLVLFSGPSRILAAGVLGLAGTLALWPSSTGERGQAERGLRLGSGRRITELEAEVARATRALERSEADRAQLVGALRNLDQWIADEAACTDYKTR